MKYLLSLLFSLSFFSLFAQTNPPINIFIDCTTCESSMNEIIKQELENVNFVRDKNDSDVHIFFTTQRNASKGRTYEIEFIGMNEYALLNNTIHFDTNADMTELEVTNEVLRYLRMGLLHFWIKNGLADKLSVTIEKTEEGAQEEEMYDAWNKWSFSIGVNGWLNGQEYSSFSNFNGSISGEQVTEANKFKFRFGSSQNRSVFVFDNEEIVSDKQSNYFSTSDVVSINDHWSAGAFFRVGNSLYSNYRMYSVFQPGVEYNYFPYKESSKKQLLLQYKVGARYNDYYETTIFNQDEELLWNQSATIGMTLRKKWGSISTEFEYENYLHDMTLDELNLYVNTNVRLFKGLSLRLFGSYGITHNQINIPAEGATLEEMLLQQRQIRSGYNYFASVGLSYSFGSIYNTIVNSRFE